MCGGSDAGVSGVIFPRRRQVAMDDETARLEMVELQIKGRGISSPRLLAALRQVPRHEFVPAHLQGLAYDDGPLPIDCGQTISQPYIVAIMTDLLNLTGEETVLEIGTGSGYQAAVLSCLAGQVYSIERHEVLAATARRTLAALGYHNVQVHAADGCFGWPVAAPYDGILVTAAAPRPPQPLLEQLAVDGRLILPVGGRGGQFLERWIRCDEKNFEREILFPVTFVPLRGKYGWAENEWEPAH